MLQRDPHHRATVEELLNDEFFTSAPFPTSLPLTTMACPPNSNFIKQFYPSSSQLVKKNSGGDTSCGDTESDPMKTDRNLSRVASRRTIVRANSTDKI